MRRLLATLLIAAGPVALRAQQPSARPSSNTLPAVSPDGSRIAFVSDRDSASALFVIGVDGAGEHRIAVGAVQRGRWSADGKEILVTGAGADSACVVAVNPGGGGRRLVATVPGRNAVLSPDAKRAAYLVGPWRRTALAVANADGSGARFVAGGRDTAWNPAWSPDGKRLAYTHGDSSRVLQVHVVNADGTGDRAVTHMTADEGSAQVPAWSPDGRRLAFQVSNSRSHRAHIWIVDLESGAVHKLAAHEEATLDEAPAWFPDGKRLAFQSNRSGRMEIWVMKDDGSEPRQVTGVRPPRP